jgi:5-methylcytosine-specific restriction protein B
MQYILRGAIKREEKTMAIDTAKIKEVIDLYKADFADIDKGERYKWIAVKHFQDNWNVDIAAPEFADMVERSYAKHVNLLDTGVARPLGVMVFFAKREPETVRSLFKTLFDETQPLESRIGSFSDGAGIFVEKIKQEDDGWKSTFQDQHAISVYLTFRHPENYYIYKYSILKTVAPMFGVERESDRLTTYRRMCDAIREVANLDEELLSMSHARLGDDCYQDPNNRMLAMDIAFFAYGLQREKEEARKLAAKPAVVQDFKKWLEAPTRKSGKPYDYKTVKVYLTQVEGEARKLAPPYNGEVNLFAYDTIASYIPQLDRISELIAAGSAKVNGAYPKVLRLYKEFLEERESPAAPTADTKPVAPTALGVVYSREKFLEEVFLTADDYDSLINQLIRKKNLILQGAPGVGKTFAAMRLVYSLIGEKNSKRIRFIQFHQSYGYEEFVMGYRPKDSGFKLVKGVFYSFCNKAAADPDNDWFFIIDEINRGNIHYMLAYAFRSLNAGDGYKMREWLTDEAMHSLYERFLLAYFKRHYDFNARKAQIEWDMPEVPVQMPKMESDVYLTHGGKTLIIDAKCYSKTMSEHFGKRTYHSNNLYQIYTYVKNADKARDGNVSGMLLYAKTDEDVTPDGDSVIGGNGISVKTLDLTQRFDGIKAQLDKVAAVLLQ